MEYEKNLKINLENLCTNINDDLRHIFFFVSDFSCLNVDKLKIHRVVNASDSDNYIIANEKLTNNFCFILFSKTK